jgi:hypothetical protein
MKQTSCILAEILAIPIILNKNTMIKPTASFYYLMCSMNLTRFAKWDSTLITFKVTNEWHLRWRNYLRQTKKKKLQKTEMFIYKHLFR